MGTSRWQLRNYPAIFSYGVRDSLPNRAQNGKPKQENACGAGLIGLAICRGSLGLGCRAALEECSEALSISSGSIYARGAD
jgi:hypothetical protein